MIDIRVKASGCINNVSVSTESKTSVDDSLISSALGRLLYSVECMGFAFETDIVYQEAIKNYNIVKNKYNTIYLLDTCDLKLEVAIRKRDIS